MRMRAQTRWTLRTSIWLGLLAMVLASPTNGASATEAETADVPEVVDPQEAQKALEAGLSPEAPLPAGEATSNTTVGQVFDKAQAQSASAETTAQQSASEPAAANSQAATDDDDPIANIAREAQLGDERAEAARETNHAEVWPEAIMKATAPQVAPELPALPAFLGLTPYVTTKAEVEARFGDKAHWADDAPLGPRHLITDEDMGLGALSLLVGYTADGLVSDIYVQIPVAKADEARATLQTLTQSMDPQGLWGKSADGRFWRTPVAELTLTYSNDMLTVLYGAVARQAYETRRYLDEAPEERYPRFAGVWLGRTTLGELRETLRARPSCHVAIPSMLPNGAFVTTLTGACFGLPGEQKSDAWFDAETHRLVRLVISSSASSQALEPVEEALNRRFEKGSVAGEWHLGTSPARNVWMPKIRFSVNTGRLEFDVPVEGMMNAQTSWEALQKAEAARQKEIKRIEALFQ